MTETVNHGFKYSEVTATSNVPQGSVMGPLLIVTFLDDISLNLNSNILLYRYYQLLFKSLQDNTFILIFVKLSYFYSNLQNEAPSAIY